MGGRAALNRSQFQALAFEVLIEAAALIPGFRPKLLIADQEILPFRFPSLLGQGCDSSF